VILPKRNDFRSLQLSEFDVRLSQRNRQTVPDSWTRDRETLSPSRLRVLGTLSMLASAERSWRCPESTIGWQSSTRYVGVWPRSDFYTRVASLSVSMVMAASGVMRDGVRLGPHQFTARLYISSLCLQSEVYDHQQYSSSICSICSAGALAECWAWVSNQRPSASANFRW